LKVYLILDEFILAGELQETSKKVYTIPLLFLEYVPPQVIAPASHTCMALLVNLSDFALIWSYVELAFDFIS